MPKISLSQSDFVLAETVRNIHTARPGAGVPLERLFDRNYWAHVASGLRAGDRIEVEPQGGTWFAELRADVVGPNWAKMILLRHVDLVAARIAAEEIRRRLDLAAADQAAE